MLSVHGGQDVRRPADRRSASRHVSMPTLMIARPASTPRRTRRRRIGLRFRPPPQPRLTRRCREMTMRFAPTSTVGGLLVSAGRERLGPSGSCAGGQPCSTTVPPGPPTGTPARHSPAAARSGPPRWPRAARSPPSRRSAPPTACRPRRRREQDVQVLNLLLLVERVEVAFYEAALERAGLSRRARGVRARRRSRTSASTSRYLESALGDKADPEPEYDLAAVTARRRRVRAGRRASSRTSPSARTTARRPTSRPARSSPPRGSCRSRRGTRRGSAASATAIRRRTPSTSPYDEANASGASCATVGLAS